MRPATKVNDLCGASVTTVQRAQVIPEAIIAAVVKMQAGLLERLEQHHHGIPLEITALNHRGVIVSLTQRNQTAPDSVVITTRTMEAISVFETTDLGPNAPLEDVVHKGTLRCLSC